MGQEDQHRHVLRASSLGGIRLGKLQTGEARWAVANALSRAHHRQLVEGAIRASGKAGASRTFVGAGNLVEISGRRDLNPRPLGWLTSRLGIPKLDAASAIFSKPRMPLRRFVTKSGSTRQFWQPGRIIFDPV